MPREILEHVKERGLTFRTAHRLEEVIRDADVLYVTRIQRERFPDPQEYESIAGSYRVDEAILRDAKRGLIIMHPLPRLTEIAPEVDRHGHDARPEPGHGVEGHREGRGPRARFAGDRQDRLDRADGHRECDPQLQRRREATGHAAGPRRWDPSVREPELHLERPGA